MLRSLASVCFRHRWRTLIVWVVAVVGLSVGASAIGDSFAEGFSIDGTESQDARVLLQQVFPEQSGDSGQLVVRTPGGVDAPEVQALIDGTLAKIERVDDVSGTISPFSDEGVARGQVSADGDVAYAQIQFTKRAPEVTAAVGERIRDLVADARADLPDGAQLELGGRMFEERSIGSTSEAVGLLAAIVILLIAFGSLLAMGIPIATALFGIGVGFALIAGLSHVFTTPDFTTQLGAMLGLGVGIDYALFIVTRYRQGLHDGLDPHHAAVLALDTAGRAVLFAGATVVVSLFGMFLMGVDFIMGLGAGAAATVLVTMIASITLVPALLGFVGTNIDRFRIPGLHRKENAARETWWFRWSRFVQRRPWPAALAGFAVLAIIAVPFFSLRLGFSDSGNDPTTSTTRRAYDLLSDGFGPGFNGPLVVAVDSPDAARVLAGLAESLTEVRGVARVSPPIAAPDGASGVIQVIPTSAPQSDRTEELVHRLRDDVLPDVQGDGTTVLVGGITAGGVDVSEYIGDRLPLFIGAVLGLSFLLLLAVFRSVLVPLKAVLVNLLSIGAAYGVIVAIFQWGWFGGLLGVESTGPIEPFVPMMLFAIVFGLSMDYEVFLLSRVREEYDRSGDNALAVADGLASTARVITAAAAIMVMVFGSFALADERLLKLFGLGLASAIFLDATIVRIVLVPATMELLGNANWWFPRWLGWVPRLHVEPAGDLETELAALEAEQRTKPEPA